MEETIKNAEMIISMGFRESTSTTSENPNTNAGTNEEHVDNNDGPDGVMCILWKNNHIGAAFYKNYDHQV